VSWPRRLEMVTSLDARSALISFSRPSDICADASCSCLRSVILDCRVAMKSRFVWFSSWAAAKLALALSSLPRSDSRERTLPTDEAQSSSAASNKTPRMPATIQPRREASGRRLALVAYSVNGCLSSAMLRRWIKSNRARSSK